MKNKPNIDWKFEIYRTIGAIVIVAIIGIPFYLFVSWSDKKMETERQNSLYEFEITDKYDYMGSNFYLIGGRATEQEYHVVYKITPLTETAKENFYGDSENDIEVSAGEYRKIKVGTKFKGHSQFFRSYY